MIKKSLRAYITRSLLKNAVLLTGDAVRFAHFQALEQDVQRGLVVVIVLVDFGGSNHLHDHREVLFFGRGLVQQLQHEGLKQGCLGLYPERIAALRMRWRGVLNQIFYQSQHFTVIMNIYKWVVTERCSGIYKVKNDDLIPLLLQQIAGLTQNFSFWVRNDHRAGTLQHIRHTVGACLACAGAADNQDVGVVLMLITIYSNVKVLRQQQIRSSLVHVELV